MRRILVGMSAATLLGGCGALLESPYERPVVGLPQMWPAMQTSGIATDATDATDATEVTGDWWQVFGDPRLDALVLRVLERNADLAAAALRLRRARLQADLMDTNLTPDASLGGNAAVSRKLDDASAPSQRSYAASLSLAYELDLWGKLARTRNAAAWQAEATRFDLQSTRLALIGTTAATYWMIGQLNERLADAAEDIADAQRAEALAASRYRSGADGMLALALARRALAASETVREQLLQQRESQRKALVMLLDEPMPLEAIAGYALHESALPAVPPDLPAGVLARRPDVAAAEARIRGSLAAHDAARASFFPTLSLTGSLGGRHQDLGQVLANPIGALGAGLAMPFLQWNTVKLNVGISRTDYETSIVAYRKAMYQAFAEVDEALAWGDSLAREAGQLERAMQAAVQAEAVSASRYRAGKSGIRFWLDDKQALRAARAAVVGNRASRLRIRMGLYQALGGA